MNQMHTRTVEKVTNHFLKTLATLPHHAVDHLHAFNFSQLQLQVTGACRCAQQRQVISIKTFSVGALGSGEMTS